MTTRTKRILLIAAGVILLVFLLLKIATQVVTEKLPEILNKEVKDYSIDLEDIDVSLFTGTVSVKGIFIKSLASDKTGVNAEIDAFKIQGIDFYEVIFNDKLILNHLSIEKAKAKIDAVKSQDKKNEKPFKKFLEEVFVRVKVNSISINNSSISYWLPNDTIPKINIGQFSLRFEGIVLDTITAKKVFPFNVAEVTGTITKAKFKMDSLYDFRLSKLTLSQNKISIDSATIKTELSKEEFQRIMPIQKDWIYFMAPKLEIVNYSWKTDSLDFYFKADKVGLKDIELVAYRDKNHPFGPKTQKPMPSEMIRNIPFNLQIDSVEVKKGSIRYLETPEGKSVKGQVDFDKVYATIYNITNDSAKLADNPWLVLDAQSRFNYCGHLETHWEFKIPDARDHFKVSGKLDQMQLKCVNQTFTPMLGIEANGTIHQIKFNYTGDVARSKGEVFFDYENLQVNFINDEDKSIKNWLKNTLGNVVLRSNNLPSGASYQKGEFEFERVQHKSVFNYLWKSINKGLVPIVVPFKGEKMEE